MGDLQALIDNAPNIEILNSILTVDNKLKRCEKAVCSISGGSDSDIVLDLCVKLDAEHKVTYVFFDTGLEYQATKKHLEELERKYGINIL